MYFGVQSWLSVEGEAGDGGEIGELLSLDSLSLSLKNKL